MRPRAVIVDSSTITPRPEVEPDDCEFSGVRGDPPGAFGGGAHAGPSWS